MKRICLCLFCVFVLLLSCACRESEQQESTGGQTTVATTKVTAVSTTTSTQGNTTTQRPVLRTSVKKTTARKTVTTTADGKGVALPLWKQLYLLLANTTEQYDRFMLLHIDDDNIPEMFMYGKDGHALHSYRENGNGGTIQQKLNKNNGAYYIPKSGRFMNVYEENDYVVLKVYELTATRGFKEVFTGYEYSYEKPDSTVEREYYLNYPKGGTAPLTSAEFLTELGKVFDWSSAVTFVSSQNSLVTFEQFDKQVREWK